MKSFKNNLRRLSGSGQNINKLSKLISKRSKDKKFQLNKDVQIVKVNNQKRNRLKKSKNVNQCNENSDFSKSQIHIEPSTSELDSQPTSSKDTQETILIDLSDKNTVNNQIKSKNSSFNTHENDLSTDTEIVSLNDLTEQASTEIVSLSDLQEQVPIEIDFVSELGHKQYIQMVLTEIFSYCSDKEIAAAFCVSKRWRNVLTKNRTIDERRRKHIRDQIAARRHVQMVRITLITHL